MAEVVGNEFAGFAYAHILFATQFFIQEEVIFMSSLKEVEP